MITIQDKAAAEALALFLENCGEDFLTWRDGCIVVETFHDKQFRALGGDTRRLISFFEDYSTMHDAAKHYMIAFEETEAVAEPSNDQAERPG